METTVEEKIESLNHVNKLRMWGIYQRELDAAEVARGILEQRKTDEPKQRKRCIGFMDNDFIEEN